MYLGKIKNHVDFRALPETDQLVTDGGVIQKRKFILSGIREPFDPRLTVKIIVVTKAVLVDQAVDHFAALTTENMFFQPDMGPGAVFTAMKTLHFIFNGMRHRNKGKITGPSIDFA
jgi:hypothetical protein